MPTGALRGVQALCVQDSGAEGYHCLSIPLLNTPPGSRGVLHANYGCRQSLSFISSPSETCI